ncbi:hypothetical protein NGA_0164300 [Nannochloropsis gaditana CCMP526]|nr:hypothetical protein NGA_0164300 [Nannochloropsis gaditana CCMP526]EKU21817.1 hypothetical protein NGA_0164300 [Nannochloropsis gaditana CCMP526]|eukprot:XP_005854542.1 hypothetical protein NGA_0164300 [Nannochloropsis gaditana CCMP526]
MRYRNKDLSGANFETSFGAAGLGLVFV